MWNMWSEKNVSKFSGVFWHGNCELTGNGCYRISGRNLKAVRMSRGRGTYKSAILEVPTDICFLVMRLLVKIEPLKTLMTMVNYACESIMQSK